MISQSYNSQRGTMLIVAVVATVVIGALCASYLTMANASFGKTKSDAALFHTKTYASSGLTAALANLKVKLDDTDASNDPVYPTSASLTASEKQQLLGDGHSTEEWKRNSAWTMNKSLPGGSFQVDLYMKLPVVVVTGPDVTAGPVVLAEDATTKTYRTTKRTITTTTTDMLLASSGSMQNFNGTSSKVAFYQNRTVSEQYTYFDAVYNKTVTIISNPLRPPVGKMGAITIQANTPGVPLPGDLGLFGVEVEVNGANGKVLGFDHSFTGVQRTDGNADHNYGITTNTTTNITAIANSGSNHIVGSPSATAQNIGDTAERDFLDKLVAFASTPGKADQSVIVAPGNTGSINNVGTPGQNGDYKLTYVKIGSGGKVTLNGNGPMCGVIVMECDGPITGQVFSSTGGVDWQGIIVLKLNGDINAAAANQDLFNFGGNPTMLGSIAVRLNFDNTPFADLGTANRHNSTLILNGTPGLKYSSVVVGKAIAMLQSKGAADGTTNGPIVETYLRMDETSAGAPTVTKSFTAKAIIER